MAVDPWIWGILIGGLVLRLLLMPRTGYEPDVAFWKSYLTYAVSFGVTNVYALETPLQPYPPVLMILLWGIGLLYRALWPQAEDTAILTAFVKVPAVAADLAGAFLLARFARSRGVSPKRAAALLAFHPVLIWISAYWGQVDILHGGLAALAFGSIVARRAALAGTLLALGALVKPQGLLVVPAGAALLVAVAGWRALARAAAAGIGVAALLLLPFAASGHGGALVRLYTGAADLYPYLSLNAWNPWWLAVLAQRGDPAFPLLRDDAPLLGIVSARALGRVLFLAATFAIVVRCARVRRDGADLAVRAWRLLTLQWLAFFLLPTQVHERYLIPALASLAPLALLGRRDAALYATLSLGIFLNVLYVLPGLPFLRVLARIAGGDGVLAAGAFVAIAVVLARDEALAGRGR
jgi:Gpi18-like mannosyltransferase